MLTSARSQISRTVADLKPFSANTCPAASSRRCWVSSKAVIIDPFKRAYETFVRIKCMKQLFQCQASFLRFLVRGTPSRSGDLAIWTIWTVKSLFFNHLYDRNGTRKSGGLAI